MLMVVSIIMQ